MPKDSNQLLLNMKLHAQVEFSPGINVLRVPNGWIYTVPSAPGGLWEVGAGDFNSVFVPYNSFNHNN